VATFNEGRVPKYLRRPGIDDPLAPPAVEQRLGERDPYVITLSASSAPLSIPPKEMVNWDQLHVYQVEREEDGRRRYRLRLGPISSELEADVILASVREHYPAAFRATADEDDLRAITAATIKVATVMAPKSAAQDPRDVVIRRVEGAKQKHAPQRSERPVDLNAPVGTHAANVHVPQAERHSVTRTADARSAGITSHPPAILTSPPAPLRPIQKSPSAPQTALAPSSAPNSPPLKAMDAPVNRDAPRTQGGAAPVPKDARPVTIKSAPLPTDPRPAPPTATAPAAPVAQQLHPRPLPAVDSTRTLRALTPTDLADDQLAKWFAIELAVGKDAFRPDDVLSLDLFKEFNLYSTTKLDQGQLLHALRLGFFLDEAAAQVVAEYLRGYFDAPTVKRVGASERERFAEGRVAARKISEATGVHEFVELSSPAPAPQTTLADLSKVTTRRDPEDPAFRPPSLSPRKR
jgi:hypothetical protein